MNVSQFFLFTVNDLLWKKDLSPFPGKSSGGVLSAEEVASLFAKLGAAYHVHHPGIFAGRNIRHMRSHVLGYILDNAASIEDYLSYYSQYIPLLDRLGETRLEMTADQLILIFEKPSRAIINLDSLIEYKISAIVNYSRYLVGQKIDAQSIDFSHSCLAPDEITPEIFGCMPKWNQKCDRIVFDRKDLQQVPYSAMPELLPQLEITARGLLQNMESELSFGEVLESRILNMNSERFPTQQEVADRLGMSCRNIQLHLKKEGLKYNTIAGRIKTNLAKELLKRKGVIMEDILKATGYSDYSAFAKSFKRNTGLTPTQYRQSLSAS